VRDRWKPRQICSTSTDAYPLRCALTHFIRSFGPSPLPRIIIFTPTESIKYNILGPAYAVLTAVLSTVFVNNMAFDLLVVSLNMYNLLGSMLTLSMRMGRKNLT
jgi:hypothetical protein